MRVLGETVITNFAKKHPNAPKPFQRFLELARAASWSNSLEVRRTFQDADFLPKTSQLIFDIGGNNFRVIALVNFEKQTLLVQSAWTHKECDRERL